MRRCCVCCCSTHRSRSLAAPRAAAFACLPAQLREAGCLASATRSQPPALALAPCLPPPAVAVVLGFVGAKILADFGGYHVSTEASLAVVAGVLGVGVGASLIAGPKAEAD